MRRTLSCCLALALCSSACENTPEEPDLDRSAMDGEIFLERLAQEEPTDAYEFVGYVQPEGETIWIHDEEPASSVVEALANHGVDVHEPMAGFELPPGLEDTDATRGLLLSADGRLFIETHAAFQDRLEEIARLPEADVTGSQSEGYTPPELYEPRQAFVNDIQPAAGGIHGPDQRFAVTSSSYPFRAVGVQGLRRTGGGDMWSQAVDWKRHGSATMVGPRAALTAAHVFVNGDSLLAMGLAPAARGVSWAANTGDPGPGYANNTKFPYGIRRVTWYAWPLGVFDGSVADDYGVLTLQDLNWSPGWIRVGHQSTTWLDFRHNWNMYGYPRHSCANSYDENGACGGYMYGINGETRGAYPSYVEHWLDTADGQSGSGLYISKNGDRVVYLVNHGSCIVRDCGVAKRLRSGSRSNVCSWIDQWPSTHFTNPSC